MQFEKTVEVCGQDYTIRCDIEPIPAQRGGYDDPSWESHYEIDGAIEVELFGVWFNLDTMLEKMNFQERCALKDRIADAIFREVEKND